MFTRRRQRSGCGPLVQRPVRLTAEGTCTCRLDPELVWSLVEDPSSPLHLHDGVVHGAWLDGTGTGVGGVQVFVHEDATTGARSMSALEVTEHVPGEYAASRLLPGPADSLRYVTVASARLRRGSDGSVAVTHAVSAEVPAGTFCEIHLRHVQAELDAWATTTTARCEEMLSRR